MKLKEIAERLNAHFKRWEADPKINRPYSGHRRGLHPYYQPGAAVCGNKVLVTYISYQGGCYLSKSQALNYLLWIESGNIGKHWNLSKLKLL